MLSISEVYLFGMSFSNEILIRLIRLLDVEVVGGSSYLDSRFGRNNPKSKDIKIS